MRKTKILGKMAKNSGFGPIFKQKPLSKGSTSDATLVKVLVILEPVDIREWGQLAS